MPVRVDTPPVLPQTRPPAKGLLQPQQATVHDNRVDTVLLQLSLLVRRSDEPQPPTLAVALPDVLRLADQRAAARARLAKLLVFAVGQHTLQEAQLAVVSLAVVVPMVVRRDDVLVAAIAKAKSVGDRHGNVADIWLGLCVVVVRVLAQKAPAPDVRT